MWREQVPGLSESNRVINVDLRGHGKSSPVTASFTLYDLVYDVIEVLDSLGLERAIWAGLSVGGMMSMRAALVAPERVTALLLLDTHAGAETPLRRIKYTIMTAGVRRFGLGPLMPAITPMMFGKTTRRLNPELVGEWQEKFRGADLQSIVWYARALMRRDSILDRLNEIDVPTLVMVGEEDTSLTPKYAQAIAAGIPDARLVIVPGAGHLLALEQPNIVTEQMCEFSRSVG
jgi:3-oxoadipate enol-lactonase